MKQKMDEASIRKAHELAGSYKSSHYKKIVIRWINKGATAKKCEPGVTDVVSY